MSLTKTGLVLEGGGLRGMYTAGVLDAFLEQGITFDVGVGVSAGAAYGISYVSGQKGRNLKICEKYLNDKRYVSLRNLFKEGALFGQTFVYEDIPRKLVPFDYDAYFKSKTKFLAGVTNILTGEIEYYQMKNDRYKYDLFKATCALPLVSPIIPMGTGLYLDGGIADPIPYKQALKEGCEKLVIILTRHRGYVKEAEKAIWFSKLYYRKYPKLIEAMKRRHIVYNEQLEEIAELEKEGKAVIIAPTRPVKIKRIETNIDKIRGLYSKGYEDGHFSRL